MNPIGKTLLHGMLAIAAVIISSPGEASEGSEVLIASWNVQRLGQEDGKNIEAVAHIAGKYDLLALQEVMSDAGLRALHQAVEEKTGEAWGTISSHLIGRGSYKELYAFMWRESRVRYVDGAVVYVDSRDAFAREPFSARFQTAGGTARWVMANVHILHGRSRADRVPELVALSKYVEWLREVYPTDNSFVLAGDFNVHPNDSALRPLRRSFTPAVTRGATTLSSINGRFANLYDNLYLGRAHGLRVTSSGIDRFPSRIGWTHGQARRHISDHAPVFISILTDEQYPPRTVPARPPEPGLSSTFRSQGDLRPPLRGNRRSMIYHHPDCPGFDKIALHNRVALSDEMVARRSGYRPARNCDWP